MKENHFKKAAEKSSKNNLNAEQNVLKTELSKEQEVSFGYFQVKLWKDDINRTKSIAVAKGVPIQNMLINAINLWMTQEGQLHVSNPKEVRTKP